MVLNNDEEVLWTVVLEYLKTYVGRNGISESTICNHCIEEYVRRHEDDTCSYLFFWDSRLGNFAWENYRLELKSEITKTLGRLAKHLTWVERSGSSKTKYYVRLDREPKVISEAKLVNEPKTNKRQLEKSILQAFKRLFEKGLSYERASRHVRRQEYIAQFSERRIVNESIQQYIIDRKLCRDCLFDKSGYWELRKRIKLEIPDILLNLVKRISFVQINEYKHNTSEPYTIHDYLPPTELRHIEVDKKLVEKLFYKILSDGTSSTRTLSDIIHECICSYVSAKKLDITILRGFPKSREGYVRFEGKDFADPVDGFLVFRDMQAEFYSVFNAIKRKKPKVVEGNKLSKHFRQLDEFMNK